MHSRMVFTWKLTSNCHNQHLSPLTRRSSITELYRQKGRRGSSSRDQPENTRFSRLCYCCKSVRIGNVHRYIVVNRKSDCEQQTWEKKGGGGWWPSSIQMFCCLFTAETRMIQTQSKYSSQVISHYMQSWLPYHCRYSGCQEWEGTQGPPGISGDYCMKWNFRGMRSGRKTLLCNMDVSHFHWSLNTN